MRSRVLLREAVATARAQPVASVVSILLVAATCAGVLLTAGRTVGAEQAVLGTLDAVGTRSIVIRADSDAGLASDVIQRLAAVRGVEWAGAFGAATDVTNASVPGGTPVAARSLWCTDPGFVGIQDQQVRRPGDAWASAAAVQVLGMQHAVGGVVTADGIEHAVVGALDAPAPIAFLEPLLLVPQQTAGTVSVLVVVADRPARVAPVASAVQAVLGVHDPSKVRVETSTRLAELRAIIQGELGAFSRNLVLLLFGISAGVSAAIQYGLVMLRRKDFGRRRALGASRGLVGALVVVQTTMLSGTGAVLGVATALAALHVGGDPLPGAGFVTAVGVLAIVSGVVAAVLPAIAASRRDPIRELRVP